MDKQAVLNLSKAEALDNNQFKIQVGEGFYIYQVPETKDVELVVEKINNWVNKGVDQWGGLYDYINRNFKLLSSDEPVETTEEPIEDEVVVEEEESVETEEKEILVEEHDGIVTITIGKYSSDFNPKSASALDDFKVQSEEVIKSEMNNEDYAKFMAIILSNLDPVDFARFSEFMAVFTGAAVEEEIEDETGIEIPEEPVEDVKPTEELPGEEIIDEPVEESEEVEEPTEELESVEQPEEVSAEEVEAPEELDDEENQLNLQDFIELAKELNLSLFEFKRKEEVEDGNNDPLYLIGRVSPNNGSLEYLTYGEDEESMLEVPDNYDAIAELPVLLNILENRDKYISYLDKIAKTIIELDNRVTLEDMEKGE